MNSVTRPPLRYHGGKWKIAQWVIRHFPPHKVYLEPCGGGASVLLRKPRVPTEIYNDLDAEVVNFFRVLRDEEAAQRLSDALCLTPYARDEYDGCYAKSADPIEAARHLVARSFMGMSSKGIWQKSGFDARVNDDGFVARVNSLRAMPEVVLQCAERLRGVVIEHGDGVKLLSRFDRPDCLIYIDPPYLPETRTVSIYAHDMSRPGHLRLLEVIRSLRQAMIIVSGYPSELYDNMLPGWQRITREAVADTGAARVEALWLNPACIAALSAKEAA